MIDKYYEKIWKGFMSNTDSKIVYSFFLTMVTIFLPALIIGYICNNLKNSFWVLLVGFIATYILGEICFVKRVKNLKRIKYDILDVIFIKIAYVVGAIPFIFIPYGIILFWKGIFNGLKKIINFLLVINYIPFLRLLGKIILIGLLIWLCFYINIRYVKKEGKYKK